MELKMDVHEAVFLRDMLLLDGVRASDGSSLEGGTGILRTWIATEMDMRISRIVHCEWTKPNDPLPEGIAQQLLITFDPELTTEETDKLFEVMVGISDAMGADPPLGMRQA
jgi:hypothetical protein